MHAHIDCILMGMLKAMGKMLSPEEFQKAGPMGLTGLSLSTQTAEEEELLQNNTSHTHILNWSKE